MKKILYLIVGLLAIYLIMCLVGPKQSVMERTTVVKQNPEVVKAQLVDFKFFNEKWSPWTQKDPNMKITYTGEVGKPGYKYDWEGNPDSVGIGAMEFAGISGDSIKQKLIFKDWNMVSDVYLIVSPEAEGAKVTWKMVMPMGFIWRGMGLFMDAEKMMGRDFDNGISKMKIALEELKPITTNYEIKELDWEAKTFYGIKTSTTLDKLSAFFGESYGKIGAAMGKAKVQPVGAPKAIYFTFDEKNMKTDVAAVMEFANGTKLEALEKWEVPAGKVLLIEYYGAYDKSAAAHYAMDDYMKGRGVSQSLVMEEYVTDPMSEKDTSKWLTNIYYVIKK